MRVVSRWQDVGGCGRLRPGDLSADRAGRNPHLRIVANPFGFAHVAARHDVEPAIFFSEPHWSSDGGAVLAEGFEGNIFLTLNRCGYGTLHVDGPVEIIWQPHTFKLAFQLEVISDHAGW